MLSLWVDIRLLLRPTVNQLYLNQEQGSDMEQMWTDEEQLKASGAVLKLKGCWYLLGTKP